MPVFILAGDEEFLLYRRLEELKKSWLDPTWATLNYMRMDGASIVDIIDAAASLPFGPTNKVIVVDRCDLFTRKKSKGDTSSEADDECKGGSKKDMVADFEQALKSVAPNTYLVFVSTNNFDSNLKMSKAAAKYATVEPFSKERYFIGSNNAKLENWCAKEAKRFGATIDNEAVRYLLDGTEANLRQISAEIEKAAVSMLPKKHITLDLVEELSPYHSHVFTLADRWLSGNAEEAMASVTELLSRQNAMQIMAAMQTFLSKWIQMRVLMDKHNSALPWAPGVKRRELPLTELAKRIATELKTKEFVVEKDLKRISKMPTQKLIEKRNTLTRLEFLVKTGQIPEGHALELFIAG